MKWCFSWIFFNNKIISNHDFLIVRKLTVGLNTKLSCELTLFMSTKKYHSDKELEM